jgi:eukaryotic-like serine/threonine-protein kinase
MSPMVAPRASITAPRPARKVFRPGVLLPRRAGGYPLRMQPGDTVRDRYHLESVLGKGAGGTTYLATDHSSGDRVVLKALSLAGMERWRDLDNLEREAKVLASLSHPRVPRYIDSFSVDDNGAPAFVLVQQRIAGSSLERKVQEGWRGTEDEIRRIAIGLLAVVGDMHALRPPVIHRDINPRNVIAGDDGNTYLVDFGGVRDAVRREALAGMTVTGTPGYVPLEQWSGNATERSDLYACGATVLFLLTHANPAEMPSRDMRIDFRSVVSVSPPLGWVLDRLLEPDEAKRTLDPARAMEVLESGRVPGEAAPVAGVPYASSIRVEREGGVLTLVIPERGSAAAGATILGFSAFWLVFVAFWTVASIAMGAPVFFPIFSIPFWLAGIFMVRRGLRSFFGRTTLRFSPAGMEVARRIFLQGRKTLVPLGAISKVSIAQVTSWQPRSGDSSGKADAVQIQAGAKSFALGECLSDEERDWVRDLIRSELERLRG